MKRAIAILLSLLLLSACGGAASEQTGEAQRRAGQVPADEAQADGSSGENAETVDAVSDPTETMTPPPAPLAYDVGAAPAPLPGMFGLHSSSLVRLYAVVVAFVAVESPPSPPCEPPVE